jgi:predicted transposase YdaD
MLVTVLLTGLLMLQHMYVLPDWSRSSPDLLLAADVLVSLVLVTVAMGLYSLLYARDMARSFRYLQRLPYNVGRLSRHLPPW